ncbi:hypothetical protein QU814_01510 [Providencia rettgeri]|uniref:hypothetical protein n=1 Tax=Providencia rettgeri TaxID=587 RepID=UPI00223214BB|nr:hypothetical protein [Providencia rettgeri]MDM9281878.1 hypothetical protein [Providencia rettgeri]
MTTEIFEINSVKEVKETYQPYEVNNYLETKEWVLLSTADGKDETGYPMFKYSLGRIK